MKKPFLIFFLNISAIIYGFGQVSDSIKAKIACISIGYQNFRTLDKNVSPLIYSAHNGFLAIQFQKNRSKSFWEVGASFSVGSNQSKRFGQREATVYDHYTFDGNRDSSIYVINPGVSFLQATAHYSFLKKINHTNNMYLGGIVFDNFIYGALGADVWFFNQLSFSPVFQFDIFNHTKFNIYTDISSPIFSYLLRQPYTLDPSLPENSYFKAYLKTGSAFHTINKFQQINIEIHSRYKLRNDKQIGIAYYFSWMNYANIPNRNLKFYSNSVLFSYAF